MLFDTHAHYDDEAFDADRDAVLSAMEAGGISLIINPGCDALSSRRAIALAEKYPFVYAAAGWHPENCAPFDEAALCELRALLQHPRVCAIGEIGLDYYWEGNPSRDFQKKVLECQLCLAEETGLPVIFHDREAHGDALAAVAAHPRVQGVFHCFSGSVEMARALLELGWYLGFDGPVTYKNARKTVEVAQFAPLDRILIETDSPYMAPVPHRGERNDSRFVRHVAEKLAALRGLSVEEVERITEENGRRLFKVEG